MAGDPAPVSPSLQEIGLAVKRLQWQHHREANRRLPAHGGLSLVQWDVLRHLRDQPDATLHALAELTFQSDQAMGTLAKRMIDRGLIKRTDGPGRSTRHEPTGAGERAYEAGAQVVEAVLDQSIGALDDTERAALHELLIKATHADDRTGSRARPK